jgi:DNA-binding NarL/FixJ family response regulator
MIHTQLLIVSHYPLFDRGLRAILSRQPGVEVVGVCRDLETATVQAQTHHPDVLVVVAEPQDTTLLSRESTLRQLNGLAPTLIQIDLADNSMQVRRRQPGGPTVTEMEQVTLDDLVVAIQASAERQSLDRPEQERGQQ